MTTMTSRFPTARPRLNTLFYRPSPSSPSSLSRTMATAAASGPVRFGPYDVTTQVFLTTPHSFALVNLKPLLPGHVLVCPRAPHRRLTDMPVPEVTDLFATVQRVQHMLARHYFGTRWPGTQSESPSSLPSASSSSPQSLSPDTGTGTSPAVGVAGSAVAASSSAKREEAPASPNDGSFNIAIQDGADAGQTVPHVHVHVIPRIPGHTAKDGSTIGDAIYEDMAGEKGNVGGALWDRDRAGRGVDPIVAVGGGGGGSRPKPGGAFDKIEDAERAARSMAVMEHEAGVFRELLARMETEG
ncbi:bis(5'-adenosyl)-triphosphatase [Microdochium nivale]|nr:bis(5'-adenosyl)-triphosphatase [Microdochium nivale]